MYKWLINDKASWKGNVYASMHMHAARFPCCLSFAPSLPNSLSLSLPFKIVASLSRPAQNVYYYGCASTLCQCRVRRFFTSSFFNSSSNSIKKSYSLIILQYVRYPIPLNILHTTHSVNCALQINWNARIEEEISLYLFVDAWISYGRRFRRRFFLWFARALARIAHTINDTQQ